MSSVPTILCTHRVADDIVSLDVHWTALNSRGQQKMPFIFPNNAALPGNLLRRRRDLPLVFSEPVYFYKRRSKCLICLSYLKHTRYYAKTRGEPTVSEKQDITPRGLILFLQPVSQKVITDCTSHNALQVSEAPQTWYYRSLRYNSHVSISLLY